MKINFDRTVNEKDYIPVVAYMRYSSNNQDETSIEYQRNAIRIYAFSNHYYIATEYIDEARTGTNDRREGFQELIADAQTRPQWKKILVYDLSRFSRNNSDTVKYNGMLSDLDIELVSVTQRFDTTPEGIMMRGVINLLNEYYSSNLAKYTHAGLKRRANELKHCGGKPPLGFDVVNEYLVVNEAEAEIVRLIFDMYELNYSYSKMADELNKRGYKTKAGKAFNKNSFFSILQQEKYVGTYIWNKVRKKNSQGRRNSHKQKDIEEQVIEKGAIPAIIDQAQFDRVQALMHSRQNGIAESKSRRHYLLSGIGKLKCAECGCNLIGTARKSHGIEYTYYYCPNHLHRKCQTKDIRTDYLDDFVINAVVRDIHSRNDLIDIFNSADEKGRIAMLRAKLIGLEKASTNIKQSLRRKSSEELEEELERIVQEKKDIQIEIDTLTRQQEPMTTENCKAICSKLARMMLTSESFEVKRYLSAVIDSIIVSNTDIELSLNIA